jgi:opacity protein-like surface antigen
MKNFNVIKKVAIIAIAAVTVSTLASAQEKGDKAVGANLVFGTEGSNIGLGAKFQYNVTAPIRLEGSFTYFFEKDYTSMWDLSVNAHYLFPLNEKLTVYPLAGLGIVGATTTIPGTTVSTGGVTVTPAGELSSTDFGLNLGGGADYKLSDKLFLNAELKYTTGGSSLLISAGIAYKF